MSSHDRLIGKGCTNRRSHLESTSCFHPLTFHHLGHPLQSQSSIGGNHWFCFYLFSISQRQRGLTACDEMVALVGSLQMIRML
uniref:Uncharacterized protein n=1 Tax=Tetranychus urticae TaxID=32264 RepID=T1KHT7_TETUR